MSRRVDQAGRISILKHRYHVRRYLAGQAVTIEPEHGLLHVAHNGVVVATHARRHLPEDDEQMDRSPKASKPARPTTAGEGLRNVDPSGNVSFAGTGYRVRIPYRGEIIGVRLVADTDHITRPDLLLRTHPARHPRSKEFGALPKPNGKPRRAHNKT